MSVAASEAAESQTPHEGLLTAVVSVLGLAFYLAWEVAHRGVFQYATSIYPLDDADEWRYTACSRLVEHGFAPFAQVFSAQPPLLFYSLAGSLKIFGDSISGARGAEVAFGLLGLTSAAWIAWLMAGRLGAAATVLLLAISPAYLVYAHTVEAEGPMMALMTLALALLLAYTRSERRVLPVLAGLALAAAILMKLFAVEALAPGLWLILSSPADRHRRLTDALSFTLSTALPVVLEFALIYPAQQWDQAVRLHQRVAGLALPDLIPPGRVMLEFFTFDLGLSLLALAGLAFLLLRRRWRDLGLLTLWIGGITAMLLLFHPLFPHHPAILLTGLGVAAGVATGSLGDTIRSRAWGEALPLLLALVMYVALGPRLVHDDRHLLSGGVPPQVTTLAGYVNSHTTPTQFVAADDVVVADQAGRLVPPSLCDPSNVRLLAGYLTAHDLIAATTRYRPALVLPSGVFQEVPAYITWLARHYRAVPGPGGAAVYVRR